MDKETAFRLILKLSGQAPLQNPAFLTIRLALEHPMLPRILQIIKEETGRMPLPRRMMRHRGDHLKYFYARVFRDYGDKDFLNVKYVVAHCKKQIGDLRDPIQTEDERYFVKVNQRLAAPWDYGSLRFLSAYAMTARLKCLLEREQMAGFCPRPVLFDKPEQAAKELWQPWSHIIMPACLLPLVDNVGESTNLDNLADPLEQKGLPRLAGRGVHYDSGPYVPEELCYNAAEVARLGDFDIAMARERVGTVRSVALRHIIVSERFRHILKQHKLPGMRYTPVRLLQPGESLWENPFERMVGRYEEQPPTAEH